MKYGIAAVIVCLIYSALHAIRNFALSCDEKSSRIVKATCSVMTYSLWATCVLSLVLSFIAAFAS